MPLFYESLRVHGSSTFARICDVHHIQLKTTFTAARVRPPPEPAPPARQAREPPVLPPLATRERRRSRKLPGRPRGAASRRTWS